VSLVIKQRKFTEVPWESELQWAERENFTVDNPESCLTLLLEVDGKVVSYLVYEEVKHVAERLNFNYIQTKAEYQGKGYATQLVKKLKEKYKQKAEIWALHTGVVSKHLLTKCGFQLFHQGWILPIQQGD